MIAFVAPFIVSTTVLLIGTYIVDLIIKAPPYKGTNKDHFDGKKFHNLSKVKGRGLLDILKWSLNKDPGPWEKLTKRDAKFGQPPKPLVKDGEIVVTFVNHTTFLIQVNGLNILTDPIWSERASPFQWIGPKRMRPPGIRFEDLPQIDVVLISHNHYDHLDVHTAKKLKERFDPLFIAPLGVSVYLQEHGITDTAELDWWEKQKISETINTSAVPAQHFSGRGLSDRDKTLWCGYVIETPAGTIYFAGDTGYDGFFKKIGARFAPIDIALIPIGAYRPRWFMKPIHVDPEQAVLIHKDLNAKTSIGMHFGTFPLADEGMHEPIRDLAKARKKQKLADEEFIVMDEGQQKIFQPQKQPSPKVKAS